MSEHDKSNERRTASAIVCIDREFLAELRDYFERLKHRADVRGGPDTSAMCIADEAIEKIVAALRTRSQSLPMNTASGEPGRIPELEPTRLNAEYWQQGARDNPMDSMTCMEQAVNAWKNAAYAAWDKLASWRLLAKQNEQLAADALRARSSTEAKKGYYGPCPICEQAQWADRPLNVEALNEAGWKLLQCAGPDPIHFNRLKDVAQEVLKAYFTSIKRQALPAGTAASATRFAVPEGYTLVETVLFNTIGDVLTPEQNKEIARREGERTMNRTDSATKGG